MLGILGFNLFLALVLSYVYYRRELVWRIGEGQRGDTRQTLIGTMWVAHNKPNSWLRHLFRNFEKYAMVWVSLGIIELGAAFVWFVLLNNRPH